jgi:hypothetical protein
MGTKKDRKWKYTATKELYFFCQITECKNSRSSKGEFYHFSRLFTRTSYKSDKKEDLLSE